MDRAERTKLEMEAGRMALLRNKTRRAEYIGDRIRMLLEHYPRVDIDTTTDTENKVVTTFVYTRGKEHIFDVTESVEGFPSDELIAKLALVS